MKCCGECVPVVAHAQRVVPVETHVHCAVGCTMQLWLMRSDLYLLSRMRSSWYLFERMSMCSNLHLLVRIRSSLYMLGRMRSNLHLLRRMRSSLYLLGRMRSGLYQWWRMRSELHLSGRKLNVPVHIPVEAVIVGNELVLPLVVQLALEVHVLKTREIGLVACKKDCKPSNTGKTCSPITNKQLVSTDSSPTSRL